MTMVAEKTILLISDRNLLNPTGERTLIMDRAKILFEDFGVRTLIRLLRPGHESVPGSVELPLPDGVSLESSSYLTPWGLASQMNQLLEEARQMNPSHVIFSGTILPIWVAKFADRGHCVGVDFHGDIDEWREHPPRLFGSQWIGRAMAPVMREITRRSARSADFGLVVSIRTEAWARTVGVPRVFRIPCSTWDIPDLAQWSARRKQYRDKLDISENATVWMYSGGSSAWQMLSETITLAERIGLEYPESVFVFATPRGKNLLDDMELSVGPEQFRLVNLPASEVVPALCAADAGLMLRRDSHTNNAAFPNKFSEYLAAGLYVVTGSGLTDPADLVSRYGIGMVLGDNEVGNVPSSRIREMAENVAGTIEERWEGTRHALEEIDMRHTLSGYVQYLTDGISYQSNC